MNPCCAVQVGAVTAVSGRAVWCFSDKSTARLVLRVGTAGIDLELGGTQRISEFSTAGLGVSVGLMVRLPDSRWSWSSYRALLCLVSAMKLSGSRNH